MRHLRIIKDRLFGEALIRVGLSATTVRAQSLMHCGDSGNCGHVTGSVNQRMPFGHAALQPSSRIKHAL